MNFVFYCLFEGHNYGKVQFEVEIFFGNGQKYSCESPKIFFGMNIFHS